jgi:benzoyl-CoA 2,3-dioxygenase component B
VEEGRHLWAMVYLLHAYFGREGREEAEQLLHRNSGSLDAPRILGAFNEETPDWRRSSCSPTSPTGTASTSSAR